MDVSPGPRGPSASLVKGSRRVDGDEYWEWEKRWCRFDGETLEELSWWCEKQHRKATCLGVGCVGCWLPLLCSDGRVVVALFEVNSLSTHILLVVFPPLRRSHHVKTRCEMKRGANDQGVPSVSS